MPSGSVRDRTNSKWRTWQALVTTHDIKSKYQGRKCDFCSTFERQGLERQMFMVLNPKWKEMPISSGRTGIRTRA